LRGNDVSALFNKLKDVYELKLDELKKMGKYRLKNTKRMFKDFVKRERRNMMGLNIFWLKVHSC
jgi:hypothetical protein